jgi:DNA adenine methylase
MTDAQPKRRPPHSPIAWLGGKSKLADRIVAALPPHEAYCEPFAGGAWVLFRKPESKVEILNDLNSDLVNLYRCVKHHLSELVTQFKWMLVAREEFDRFLATPADTLTDIQRAARFYYLNKTSFGARMARPTFGVAATQRPRLNLLRIEEELSEAHLRLSRVFIECRPYSDIITRFDRPTTLFYVDPPYWDCETDYGPGMFSKDDFVRLADQLSKVAGRFIMSMNDTPQIRDLFSSFRIEVVPTRYSISAGGNSAVNELLIRNFDSAPVAVMKSHRLTHP